MGGGGGGGFSFIAPIIQAVAGFAGGAADVPQAPIAPPPAPIAPTMADASKEAATQKRRANAGGQKSLIASNYAELEKGFSDTGNVKKTLLG